MRLCFRGPMARSSSSQQARHHDPQEETEEQAKVDALNWLVRQLSWEQSLSRSGATPRSHRAAPGPQARTPAKR